MNTTIRLGRIQYNNVLPLYYSLENGITPNPFSLTYAPPSTLNNLIRNADLDISPVSSIEYIQNQEHYYLVKDLCISSKGAVKSVLLFSHVPIEMLDNAYIALTEESNTSVALVKILFKEYYNITPRYIDRKEAKKNTIQCKAMLLIGDSALQESSRNTYQYCYDLGALWYEWTNLPFVFAVWVIRKEYSTASLIQNIAFLYEARSWGRQNMSIIYKAVKEKTTMTDEDIIQYYTLLQYSFGKEEESALYHFAFLLYKNAIISKAVNAPFLYIP
ncbi:MAG: menaquinone biosynthetic enzyme MqnA/MqnD family protein [Desulfovibrionaceae bacterium]